MSVVFLVSVVSVSMFDVPPSMQVIFILFIILIKVFIQSHSVDYNIFNCKIFFLK